MPAPNSAWLAHLNGTSSLHGVSSPTTPGQPCSAADHEQDTIDMVKHYAGLTVAHAYMLSIDRLGMDLLLTRQEGEKPFKARLPYLRQACARGRGSPGDDRLRCWMPCPQ
jgi:hypothetical protein